MNFLYKMEMKMSILEEYVGLEISEVSFVCFMHHFTFLTLFFSRTNKA